MGASVAAAVDVSPDALFDVPPDVFPDVPPEDVLLLEEDLPVVVVDAAALSVVAVVVDAASVVGFYLPPETLVEVFPGVLHFAPCRIQEAGFNCLVVLEKGVNEALPQVNTAAPGEEKLLWMRGKWMLCHPDSPQAENGAYVGIGGENLSLKI